MNTRKLTKQSKLVLLFKTGIITAVRTWFSYTLNQLSVVNTDHGDLGQTLDYVTAAMQATILKTLEAGSC